MRRAPVLLLAALALAAQPPSAAAADPARRAMAEGFSRFESGRYEEAARSFDRASAAAPGARLDPAPARYDLGCALLRAGKPLEAAAAFAEAVRSPDLFAGGEAHYNRGNALVAAADAAAGEGRLEPAIGLLDEALGAFESAMRLAPQDEDPKVNHELAAVKRARLQERLRAGKGQGGGAAQQPPPAQGAPPPRPQPPGGELKPDEARTMLDALRQQELSQRSRVRPPRGEAAPVEKPW